MSDVQPNSIYRKQLVLEATTICPAPCKLTFHLLTLKVVSELHVTWATSVPILVFLGLSVLDLGPMYAIDRQTSDRRQTDRRQTASFLNRGANPPWTVYASPLPSLSPFPFPFSLPCGSVMAGAPDVLLLRLQSILNAAVQLVFSARKYDHWPHDSVAPWAALAQGAGASQVQVVCCLNGTAPHYLAETIHPVTSRGTRQRLRSADTSTLVLCHPHAAQLLAIAHFRRLPHDMEHSAATGSGCAFSSCLPTGTEDCAVPVVLSGWLTTCFVLSTCDELSPAWLLTLTESDCTVVLQQKCDNATLIIFISTTRETVFLFWTPVHSSAAGECGLLPQHNEHRIRSRCSRCLTFCIIIIEFI